jgi:hypothetical protein
MKITSLSLPDPLYDKLAKQAKGKFPEMVKEEIADRLERFQDVRRQDRAVILYGEARRELEAIFGTTINSPEDLVQKVKKLGFFKVGGVERALTLDEQALLWQQAGFHGKTPDEYLSFIFDEFLRELFNRA